MNRIPPYKTSVRRPSTSKPAFGSRTALQAVSDGVVVINAQGRIEFLNSAAEVLSGWHLADAQMQPVDKVVRLDPENATVVEAEAEPHSIGRCLLTTRSGERKRIEANVSPVCDADGEVTGRVLVLRDRTEARGLQAQLDHQSTHDALTGLINRSAFETALREALNRTITGTASHMLLYLDLDQFKIINDTCGHAAGDQYLLQLTRLLNRRVRNSDVLARLGGDEFGILLHGCDETQAESLAEELCRSIAQMTFTWRRQVYRHTASIGIARLTLEETARDGVTAALSAADIACFTAKDLGRNRTHVYRSDRLPSQHVDMQWVARISRALDEDRLVVYSQPIVPIGQDSDASVPHYEILLRLTDRFGQVILPTCFIPAAERYNLMPQVDGWIVKHTLEKLVWRPGDSQMLPKYKLSVNLSGTSLSDEGFLKQLEQLLESDPLESGTLCFEITETATIANIGLVAAFMHRMKALGCEFSLDDFGSGLSSFAYLKELPVDLIKIDGDFIADVLTSASDAAVVDAIVRVAKAMGIRTVAERVESQELLERLLDMGVDYAQGFWFAKPRRVRNRSSFNGVLSKSHSVFA